MHCQRGSKLMWVSKDPSQCEYVCSIVSRVGRHIGLESNCQNRKVRYWRDWWHIERAGRAGAYVTVFINILPTFFPPSVLSFFPPRPFNPSHSASGDSNRRWSTTTTTKSLVPSDWTLGLGGWTRQRPTNKLLGRLPCFRTWDWLPWVAGMGFMEAHVWLISELQDFHREFIHWNLARFRRLMRELEMGILQSLPPFYWWVSPIGILRIKSRAHSRNISSMITFWR